MKNNINIIQFLPYFPPHKWWLETHAEQWGKWWAKKWFWEVYNVVTDFNQDLSLGEDIFYNWKVIWYKKEGVENLIVPSYEVISNFPIYKIWTKEYKLIIQYLKKKNIDIVITRTRFFITSLVWWLFARKNKIEWCHIEHWSDYVKLNSNFKNIVAKIYDKLIWNWIFRKADKLVGVSYACSKFIKKEFIERDVEVIYRGVDLVDLGNKKIWDLKLVFIWRLVKLKWVEDLLKAFIKLEVNISLDIIWDWEELQNLKNITNKNNLQNVNFLWFKSKEFINDYLSKNKCIFINTSYQEWLPTSVIEALFYNNVAIASNVWWTSEISKESDLVLFEAGDIDWLVKNIELVIENYDDLVWKTKGIIENKFIWEKSIEKYYNLFNDVK